MFDPSNWGLVSFHCIDGVSSGRHCWIPLSFGIMDSVCGLGFEVLCAALILWVGQVSFENGMILTLLARA